MHTRPRRSSATPHNPLSRFTQSPHHKTNSAPAPSLSSFSSLGPGFHCLRFAPNPLNPGAAPPICTERTYRLSIEEKETTATAVARRRRVEGLEKKKEEEEEASDVLGVTLLLLARGDAWGANAAGREEERAAMAEAVAAWEGGEVIVVEYRDASSPFFASSTELLLGGLEGQGAGRVRVLPFVVPGDNGGRQRYRSVSQSVHAAGNGPHGGGRSASSLPF